MALYSVVLVNIWAGIPFFTITNLAGLKSVDPDLYAASAVDGANAWQRFRYVTLPGIQYTLVVSTLLSTILTVDNYGTIYLLTSGGPVVARRIHSPASAPVGGSSRDCRYPCWSCCYCSSSSRFTSRSCRRSRPRCKLPI